MRWVVIRAGVYCPYLWAQFVGSDNGLSPGRRQAIIRTNDWILLIGHLGTNFSKIWTEIHTFSFKKMDLKMSSTETKMSSFWRNFHHWLHWKLSFWQLPVQPVMNISSKWRLFRFSVCKMAVILSRPQCVISYILILLIYNYIHTVPLSSIQFT